MRRPRDGYPSVMERRRKLAALLAGVAALLAPATAEAASVEVRFGTQVHYRASKGEANRLTLSAVPAAQNAVLVADSGAAVQAGRGCAPQGPAVICTAEQLDAAVVDLGDRDDRILAARLRRHTALEAHGGGGEDVMRGIPCLLGGRGNDRLVATGPAARVCFDLTGGIGADRITGSSGDDLLTGAGGRDVLVGAGGEDGLSAGAAADVVRGGPGGDFIIGGAGQDLVFGDGGGDSIGADPGRDVIRGGRGADSYAEVGPRDRGRSTSGDDLILGGPGFDTARYFCRRCGISLDGEANDGRSGEHDDVRTDAIETPLAFFEPNREEFLPYPPGVNVLVGDGGTNLLSASGGDDRLDGRGGRDRLDGGAGDDLVLAADGEVDQVECGPGEDRVRADPGDRLGGCERLL
jgi:RTX calcium-binding nonapeptide repeat (4 copies)